MSDIIKFNFHGDELDVVKHDGDAFLILKRACEALGLDDFTQARKLKEHPAAVTSMMLATGSDGKSYEMFGLSIRSVPFWLASIHPSKIRPEFREKLIAYQRHCADVLADHFFGPRTVGFPANDTRIDDLIAANHLLMETIASQQTGMIGDRQVRDIKHRVARVSELLALLGRYKSRGAATAALYQQARAIGDWGGTARTIRMLPTASNPRIVSWLDQLENQLRREVKAHRLLGVSSGQLAILPVLPRNRSAR